MTNKELMQMAFEALESSRVFVTSREKIKHPEGTEWYDERIEALRACLAQPESEPVAWAYKVNNTWEQLSFIEPPNDAYDDDSLVPLYTAPPAPTKLINVNGVLEQAGYAKRKEWVGLTEGELMDIVGVTSADSDWNVAIVHKWVCAVEKKLKDKNHG